MCEKLRNGDISFGDFEEYFYSEECNNSDKLEKELVGFTGDSTDCGWIQSRFDQFHNFKTVYTCLKGANAIMNIVGKYGLKGDFSHISQIIKIVSFNGKFQTMPFPIIVYHCVLRIHIYM